MFKGKKVALVATGGGSKSIAHIGVLSACEELGIEIDLMIGASAGAIIAVYYSQFLNTDMLIDHFRPDKDRNYDFKQFGWKKMFSLKNFFSRDIVRGIFDLTKTEEFFAENLETNKFSDLKIPTFISATNLNDYCGVLFGPGNMDHVPISRALTASCCIPMLFRPVEIDGKFYVDGEIKRPLSTNAAAEYGADIIIVSDIYNPMIMNMAKISMFDIATEVINMVLEDKSLRGFDLAKTRHPNKKIILLSPKVSNLSTFKSSNYIDIIKAGYDAAIGPLREIVSEY